MSCRTLHRPVQTDPQDDEHVLVIENLKLLLNKQSHEIKDYVATSANFKAEIDDLKNTIEKLNDFTKELNSINRNMVDSIRVMESNIKSYQDEIEHLKNGPGRLGGEPSLLKNKLVSGTSLSKSNGTVIRNHGNSNTSHKYRQLLIVGDKSIQGLHGLIKKHCQYTDINNQWKNRLNFEQGVELCMASSKTFTKKDFIIFIQGSESAFTGQSPQKTSILKLCELSKKTNIIMLGPPLHLGRPILNRFIHEQNSIILNTIAEQSNNFHFLPMSTLVKNGILNYYDKLNLAQQLYHMIAYHSLTKKPSDSYLSTTSNSADPSPSVPLTDFLQPSSNPSTNPST